MAPDPRQRTREPSGVPRPESLSPGAEAPFGRSYDRAQALRKVTATLIRRMPKMKTHSGAKKRFKLTATGRVKRKKAYLRHNLTSKTTSAKRRLRRGGYISKTQEHQVKAMLPYA